VPGEVGVILDRKISGKERGRKMRKNWGEIYGARAVSKSLVIQPGGKSKSGDSGISLNNTEKGGFEVGIVAREGKGKWPSSERNEAI